MQFLNSIFGVKSYDDVKRVILNGLIVLSGTVASGRGLPNRAIPSSFFPHTPFHGVYLSSCDLPIQD